MLLIDDILISDEVFEVNFTCDLQKCRGACCWEGDYGAPLSPSEIEKIKTLSPQLMELLPASNREVLEAKGPSEYYVDPEVHGTSLMPDTSCVYLLRKGDDIGQCALEVMFEKGESDFKKPISCELYPIRLIENEEIGFIAMNYDKWDICSPGCRLGNKLEMPVFRFLKKGLIRKFGQEFYDQMEGYYEQMKK